MFKAGPVAAKLWGLLNYVRPGFVTLGIVIAPFLVVVDLCAAGFFRVACGIVCLRCCPCPPAVAGSICRPSRRRVEIGEDEQRVEGFSEDNNSVRGMW